jgi:diguanylate cyclase (GGDEF)-like protein/PAS domain S-box-containing protein
MKNMPMGIVVCKEAAEREVYYVNQEAYRMLGYTREEYIAKIRKSWASLGNVNIRDVISEHHDEIMRGEPFEVITNTENKKGEKVWLLNRVTVCAEKEPFSYVSIIDITKSMNNKVQREMEEEALRQQAAEDSFTKLLNRGTMESKVKETLKNAGGNARYAYVSMDIDDFKQINDVYGHGMGDTLLLELAKLLQQYFGSAGYVGRMGGDEFAAFTTDIRNHAEVEERAQQVVLGVRGVQAQLGLSLQPSVSVGIAYYPEAGNSFTELYSKADEALYRVKRSTKNGIAVY